MDPNSCLDTYVNEMTAPSKVVTDVVPTTTSPTAKSKQENALQNEKEKQDNNECLSVSLCTLCWQCEGFIYVALDFSHCGCECLSW